MELVYRDLCSNYEANLIIMYEMAESISPYDVVIIPSYKKIQRQLKKAEEIYKDLKNKILTYC